MWKTVSMRDLSESVFSLLDRWPLLSAGSRQDANPMTVSWGGLGVLYHRDVATVYVRPQRHTFGLLNRYPQFTLSFFDKEYHKVLQYCGSASGAKEDKIHSSGLTLAMAGDAAPYFEEAALVLVCRKLYWSDIDPAHFCQPELEEFYQEKDYHRMFIGGIEQVLVKEK